MLQARRCILGFRLTGHGAILRFFNALDWHLARGVPLFIRAMEAIGAPKHRVRGVDLAGRVTAVGNGVRRFRGRRGVRSVDGSFAEFVVTREKRLAHKPAGVTFEQAATLHVAGSPRSRGCATGHGCEPGSAFW